MIPGIALRLLVLVGLLGPLAACRGGEEGVSALAGRPNVLLVSIDTLRADHVGAFGAGQVSTPNLDALAERGARFDRAFSPTPLTLPSHTTLLTGLDPPRHGVRHNGIHRLTGEVDTLAERFRGAGYATGAVVGALVLAADRGLARGFDHYDDRIARDGDHVEGQRRADEVNAAALAWLDSATSPFFLFVHYYDPHATYEPPPAFASAAHSPYDGEISFVDHSVGQLLAELERRGELARTLVVVTSDHGEGLGEHDEPTHAYAVYDATQHVPLIVSGPGVPSGRVVEDVVRSADVAPTLLAQLGLPALENADGRDLSPLWSEEGLPTAAPRPAYVETLATRIDQGWSPLRGLRTREYLYIRSQRPELYRVATDPGQRDDLLARGAEGAQATAARLERDLTASLVEERAPSASAVDPATLAQLNALGYAIPERPVAETRVDPKDGRRMLGRYHAAIALTDRGLHAEAAERFEEILREHPESLGVRDWLGSAWLNAGELERAHRETLALLERDPERANGWFKLGVIRREQGHPDEAVDAFTRAIELEPSQPGPHFHRALLLLATERLDAAADADATIAAADLGGVEELRRLADAWEAAGRSEMAAAAYRRVLERVASPRDHMHLAIHLIRLGRPAEAEPHLARAGDVAQQPKARRALAEARRSVAGETSLPASPAP